MPYKVVEERKSVCTMVNKSEWLTIAFRVNAFKGFHVDQQVNYGKSSNW